MAIDWSGAQGPRQRGIAVAICPADQKIGPALVRPGHIWSREEVLDWMLCEMPTATLVGMDLGASLPFLDRGAFFPGWEQSPVDAKSLWGLIDEICEHDPNLSAASFVDHMEASRHFRRHGGREGDLFGGGRGRLRITEFAQQAQGLNPYSNLNLVGAAQVGKSSLAGMRLLHRAQSHFPVWPFDPDPGTGILVLEIYTSLAALAGGKRKGQTKIFCGEELDMRLAIFGCAPHLSASSHYTDHATDALLTAAWLRYVHDRPELWRPAGMTEEVALTEGWTFGVV